MSFDRSSRSRTVALLVALALAAGLVWYVHAPATDPAQAGGGQSNMNDRFHELFVNTDHTVTLRFKAPVNGQATVIVSGDGGEGSYRFARNGIDHLCIQQHDQAPVICIPFDNIASFSYHDMLQ